MTISILNLFFLFWILHKPSTQLSQDPSFRACSQYALWLTMWANYYFLPALPDLHRPKKDELRGSLFFSPPDALWLDLWFLKFACVSKLTRHFFFTCCNKNCLYELKDNQASFQHIVRMNVCLCMVRWGRVWSIFTLFPKKQVLLKPEPINGRVPYLSPYFEPVTPDFSLHPYHLSIIKIAYLKQGKSGHSVFYTWTWNCCHSPYLSLAMTENKCFFHKMTTLIQRLRKYQWNANFSCHFVANGPRLTSVQMVQ